MCLNNPATSVFLTAEYSPTLVKLHLWRPVLPWLKRLFPLSVLRYLASVFPWYPVRHMQAISDNVYETSRQVLRRKGELLKQGDAVMRQEIGEGKDLMSILRMFPHTEYLPVSCLTSLQCGRMLWDWRASG